MNIGIVTTWCERGAPYVSRLYQEVLQSDHRIFIYARAGNYYAKGDPNWDADYVTWGKESNLPISTPLDIIDFKNWIKSNQIDIIFFNEQNWWEPVAVCNELGVKTGAYIDYYTEETIELFGCYDFLVCNTMRHFSVFDWHPNCIYIPWGTDTSLFKPSAKRPLREDIVTFFHSAGMNPKRKGTDLVIRAFAKISSPKSRLVIHTQADIGSFYPDVQPLIDKLKSIGFLDLYENSVPAPGLYHKGDIYIYPSRLDGIGLTVPEALACGLPVITSDNPPMNEFVHDGIGKLVKIERFFSRHDGYYWPQCLVDVSDLVEKMLFFIKNKTAISDYSKKAREYAVSSLNWHNNAIDLPAMVSNIQKRPNHELQHFMQLARNYESENRSLGMTIACRYPLMYRIARLFEPLFKRHW